MTNYFASSLLDAMGKVLHLHTGTCQYLDRETGELMWLVDASDEKHWWKVASPNLYKAVYEWGAGWGGMGGLMSLLEQVYATNVSCADVRDQLLQRFPLGHRGEL